MNNSEILFERAQLFIPGGVNSPVRAFRSVGGTPLFFKSAKGSILTDVDNKEYIDFIGSWGPMILGHCHEPIVKALKEATRTGDHYEEHGRGEKKSYSPGTRGTSQLSKRDTRPPKRTWTKK